MKKLLIIIAIFLIAFVLTSLYDFTWIKNNIVRQILVTILIIFEIILGFFGLLSEIKKEN